MPDARLDAFAGTVARVEGGACRLARLATEAALTGGAAGAVLWWFTTGDRLAEWWQGTAVSVLVLLACVAPALWLLNVRFALLELVELPAKLRGVTTRRAAQLRAAPGSLGRRPEGGALETMRSIRSILGDYGDVAGSWGAVAQVVVPSFWLLTLAALVAVPAVVVLAVAAALLAG